MYKKKKKQDVKCYFPKNNKTDWTVERHRVKIPTIGWVRLKEYGYIPKSANVKSGTIVKEQEGTLYLFFANWKNRNKATTQSNRFRD